MRDALTMQSVNGDELTGQVIGCFFTTYNDLGFGLPESVYSAALSVLFDGLGLHARREHGFDVMFRNTRVGSFRLDYLIEDTLVLELKAGHLLPPGPVMVDQVAAALDAPGADFGAPSTRASAACSCATSAPRASA